MPFRYTYIGDRLTRGAQCDPVKIVTDRRPDGKCVVSTRMATALVRFEDGSLGVVARRRLRLNEKRHR